jgi:hypothetical protein
MFLGPHDLRVRAEYTWWLWCWLVDPEWKIQTGSSFIMVRMWEFIHELHLFIWVFVGASDFLYEYTPRTVRGRRAPGFYVVIVIHKYMQVVNHG